MDLEQMVSEYVRSKQVADAMSERASELKKELSRVLREQGEEDNKGNLWRTVGNYSLQYQKRQKSPTFDKARAEEVLKREGLWEELKQIKITEEIPEEDLVAYVFDHPEHEDILREVYTVPEPTWAFMPPREVEQYDDE